MKTELRPKNHDSLPGHIVVELWHEGVLIGAIYGSDGPGFRLITRFDTTVDELNLIDESIVVVGIRTH